MKLIHLGGELYECVSGKTCVRFLLSDDGKELRFREGSSSALKGGWQNVRAVQFNLERTSISSLARVAQIAREDKERRNMQKERRHGR